MPRADIELQPEGVNIRWPDGDESYFHYIWLRNCCYCAECGDTHTGKRFLQPCEVPLDIKPHRVEQEGDDGLVVVWEPDRHNSHYHLPWLRANAYSEGAKQFRTHRSILWDARISSQLPWIDYQDAENDELAYLELLRNLRDYGFVIVRNGPKSEDGINKVAGLIGEMADAAYGKVFDLSPKAGDLTLGNTMHPVPPHTDESYLHTPTGILILFCITPAANGGETVLVDGFNLAAILREQDISAFELLASQPQTFHRVVPEEGIDQRTRARVLVTDETGQVVGFRFHTRTNAPADAPADMVKKIHAANYALSSLMLDKKNHACFRLEAGDGVMFDNHRVMHSRLGFSDPNRYLKICNVSRERFHQRLRFTAHRLGFDQEANQILAPGVAG